MYTPAVLVNSSIFTQAVESKSKAVGSYKASCFKLLCLYTPWKLHAAGAPKHCLFFFSFLQNAVYSFIREIVLLND